MGNKFRADDLINISEATIGGDLNCDNGNFLNKFNANGAIINGDVNLGNDSDDTGDDSAGFKAANTLSLIGATIKGNLDCSGGTFGIDETNDAFVADGLQVNGDIRMDSHFKSIGKVTFIGAIIKGDFYCSSGQFTNYDNDAFVLVRASVGGTIFMDDGFNADGTVNLTGLKIGGDLDCSGGHFNNQGTNAIIADYIKVEGDVCLRSDSEDEPEIYPPNNFKSEGLVSFVGAKIKGDFVCSCAEFSNYKDNALVLARANIDGTIFMDDGFNADGTVKLGGSIIGGDLDCSGGHFINQGTNSIIADNIMVGGNVRMCIGFNDEAEILQTNNFKADGLVSFVGAKIRGDFVCSRGLFSNPGQRSLALDRSNIGGIAFFNDGFKSQGSISLTGAIIAGDLNLSGGELTNNESGTLLAYNVNISGDIHLNNGFKSNGTVVFDGSTTGGDLDCSHGYFNNQSTNALMIEGAKIGGNVYFTDGFSAQGEVSLINATINGDLQMTGGNFSNPDTNAYALNAERVKIGADVFMRYGFKAIGRVSLSGAVINGDWDCSNAHIINSDTNTSAIDANRVQIGGDLLMRNNFQADGKINLENAVVAHNFEWHNLKSPENAILDLSFAKVGTLYDDEKSWPKASNLVLDGFYYDEINNLTNITSRINWLRHQTSDQFRPQTYEQLESVLKKMGKDDDMIQVIVAQNEDFAKQLPWYSPSRWFWYNGLGWLIGYGYKTWQAFYPSLFFVISGALLFRFGRFHDLIVPSDEKAYSFIKKGKNDEKLIITSKGYPVFNSYIYSLEVFLPLVKLGMDDFWRPDVERKTKVKIFGKGRIITGSMLRYYWWLHIIAGWILTTLLVSGFSGLVKS